MNMRQKGSKELHLEDLSLADFVARSQKRAKAGPVKAALKWLADRLIDKPDRESVHQFSFDEKVDDILARMRLIPIEDFIAHHHRIVMPFNEFWLEQTQPVFESKRRTRFGVLLEKDEDSDIIRARFASEVEVQPEREVASDVLVMDRFVRGEQIRYSVNATNIEIIFGSQGILLDSKGSTLRKIIQKMRSGGQGGEVTSGSFGERELKAYVDSHVGFAHDVYRLLMLVSCHNVRSNLSKQHMTAREVFSGNHRSYGPDALLPPVLTPIRVDLSRNLKEALKDRDQKSLKLLLGWTDVMGHTRRYHTREGIVEREIEPHERRIAAPIDRRGAPRAITSTDSGLDIHLNAERPHLVPGRRRERKLRP